MAHRYKEYQPYKGDIQRRSNGSLIALEGGTAYAYAIDHLQDRGRFFISPQDEVYAGQVVGEHVHEKDLVINVTKAKQLTNMRASGADEKARIVPPIIFSLVKKDGLPEKAREIINDLKFHFNCQYDEKDSIGKRYRRQDAIGTPYCVTVDHDTLKDNCEVSLCHSH